MENNLERNQPLSKVVGGKPEQSEKLFKENRGNFEFQEALRFEREKTPEEMAVIKSIFEFMPEFVKAYDGQPIAGMRPEHIHFIDPEKMPEEKKMELKKNNELTKGRYHVGWCEIEIFSEGITIWDAHNTAHELIHMNSFLSATGGKHGDIGELRRLGFTIFAKTSTENHFKFYFDQTNEAVAEELANRFDQKYFGSIKELKLIYQLREEKREKLRKKGKTDEAENFQLGMRTSRLENGEYESTIIEYHSSRVDERQKLKKLVSEIYQKNKDNYASEEDVFNVFAKVIFTGKLTEVAKLIEKTYGKGNFRKLAEDTTTSFEPNK